ncbi:MAG: polymer-forming cytoskeletal protein, partial [Gammaproteobacteria bacterium]|nr:polymer-forming cytoskeletal protein [Gammaproteobacteria bacterium]
AVINGAIEGDLEVSHFLELQANARVTGNISYRQLQLECGATVDGKLLRLDGEGTAVAREGGAALPETGGSAGPALGALSFEKGQ